MFKGQRVVAVDCGRASVKYAYGNGNVSSFRSLHKEADLNQLLSMPGIVKKNLLLVMYDKRSFLIGESAQHFSNSSVAMEDEAFMKQSVLYYLVSIAQVCDDGDLISLGINLTFNTYRYKDDIRGSLLGEHKLQFYSFKERKWIKRRFKIEKVGVVYQGWSALVSIVLNNDKTFKKEYRGYLKQEGIIFDFGRRTVDIIVVKGMQPVSGVTFDHGTYSVYQRVASFLRRKYSITKPIYDIESRHLEGRPITMRDGKKIDVPKLVETYAQKVAGTVKADLAEHLYDQTPDYVYMVGGGAYLFSQYFKDVFANITVPKNPEFLNARGMLIFFSGKES